MAERMNVNPTRMMLSVLRKKRQTAVRGHKLLKDKRDELMKEFLRIARESGRLRQEAESALSGVYRAFAAAGAVMGPEAVGGALMMPKQETAVDVKSRNIMGVTVPDFSFETSIRGNSGNFPYGFAETSGELDDAVRGVSEIMPMLLELAAKEKAAWLLADELEKTRRRVNALEYVMIPRLESTIRYIRMRLGENERSSQTRLMKVKDMMIREAVLQRREQERVAGDTEKQYMHE